MSSPILLPDVSTFSDLLEYVAEWDHETMSHRNGVLPANSPRPRPRYIGTHRVSEHTGEVSGANEIGPFCTVDLSQLDGPASRSMAVRATDLVLDVVRPRIVTPDDHLSFRIIGHEHTGRALVILEHGYISGSHWLAYIDPATLPAYPYTARDAAAATLCAQIKAATDWVPYKRPLPGGAAEYGYNGVQTRPGHVERPHRPVMIARVDADGTVTRLSGELPARI